MTTPQKTLWESFLSPVVRVKPIPVTDATTQAKMREYRPAIDNNNLEGLESPVFGITA